MSRLAVLIAVVLAMAGCAGPSFAGPQDFTVGSTAHSINVGGLDRGYRLYVPAGLLPNASLVVMMHGGFGSADQAERSATTVSQARASRASTDHRYLT